MSEAGALADLDRAIAATEAVVAGIGAGQWSAPTPCTELDVRGVLDHLVSGNLLFAAIIRGEPLPDRSADHLGADPLAAFQRAGRDLREAFARPGVLELVYTAPFGTGPGAVLLGARIVEILVHGWDLARATGQPADFPDDVAARALAATRKQLTSRPEGPGAPFAAEVQVPEDARAVDRLAGFLGRPV
ncbi:MAG TPA: TIGR03086 family protein [Actinobacteria bacterium]|nr:TIGR03086 family protein [Actinomycetota bacterium]